MGRLPIFLGIGLVVIVGAVVAILYTTKGSHLELKGEIIKIRTGAIDEHNSAAVIDFRLQNDADIPFVVRRVVVTAEKDNGDKVEGDLISKTDYKQLLEFNKFLGSQYNEGLVMKDRIAPHQTVDRMAAIHFPVPQSELDSSKQLRLYIQDMDGPEFETVKSMK
ncbi:MAG TPA: hypothetical protein VKU01_02690 [Bryobacteraceae bacterium]|nr:hypothetical protein [Bryobacteraceae bacterium]